MTVKELIEELEQYPENLPVLVVTENKDVKINFAYRDISMKQDGSESDTICLMTEDFSEYAKSLSDRFKGYNGDYIPKEADTGNSVGKEV